MGSLSEYVILQHSPRVEINFDALPLTVAVIGSRKFRKLHWVDTLVSQMNPMTVLISGGAIGVDTAAEEAADKYLTPEPMIREVTEAEWRPPHLNGEIDYGAGHRRNTVIATDLVERTPSVLFAFSVPGPKRGLSGGTFDMTTKARSRDIPHVIFLLDGQQLEIRLFRFDPYLVKDAK